MEFLALVLIVVAGVVGWNAGRGHGRSETLDKSRDERKSGNEQILEKFKLHSSSGVGVTYLNYPIISPDSGPLVLITAVDLIWLSTQSQLYMSGCDASDASHHQESLQTIANIYLAENRGITEAERAYVDEYFN
ncbi:hypothetical protein ACYZTL_22490 [Pseudomonas sp. LB3P81]